MKTQPVIMNEASRPMDEKNSFTHAQIFDDLLIIAQKETACYVWKTKSGLVVFDGIWPDESVVEEIQTAIREAGWESEKITKFVMTHGHIEHVGCGKWLAEMGAETYLSALDDELRMSAPHEESQPDNWKEFAVTKHIKEGDVIDCVDKFISVVATPGHTAGCMSFFFPVHEGGKEYWAGLFGGAAAPCGDEQAKMLQRASVMKFKLAAKTNRCDVALTNRTVFDNGLERIAYSKVRTKYLPNIYILGTEGVQKFCSVFGKVS